MRRLTGILSRAYSRSTRYFTLLRDNVIQNNLLTLRRATVLFEIFLGSYALFCVHAFRNTLLDIFYLLFLGFNTVLMVFALRYARKEKPSFHLVQASCIAFVLLVMAFTICVSVFPFPDRPSIFYPLAYSMMLILFQFRPLQLGLVLTAVTWSFIFLASRFKTYNIYPYDFFSAVTSWLVGFLFIYVISDLYLRNGEAQIELDRQCHTDPLTGLPNRRGLDDFISMVCLRCGKLKIPLAVIILDVDHFKRYNDRFGHPAGDRCLVAVARNLSEFAKERGFFAARFGGEEFVLILPGCDEEETADHAQDLLLRIPFHGPEDWIVTASLGVAVEHPHPDLSFPSLLERADRALYRAKEQGRNQFVLDRQDEGQAQVTT